MEGCPGRGPARAGPLATQVEEMLFSSGATLGQHLPLLPSKYHVAPLTKALTWGVHGGSMVLGRAR